jgi:hypothetical protein
VEWAGFPPKRAGVVGLAHLGRSDPFSLVFFVLFVFLFFFTVLDITFDLGIQIDPNQFLKFCKN